MSWNTLRLGDRFSMRIHSRSICITVIIVVGVLGLSLCGLTMGEYYIPWQKVVEVCTGGGARFDRVVILDWRLPRVLLAILIGAALAMAGAIFQILTRNPLGSPDVIGFNNGAYVGAIIVMTVISRNFIPVAAGAFLGGVLTAIVVYVLTAFALQRKGFQGVASGFTSLRFIIIGVGVSAMLDAVGNWVTIRAQPESALAAQLWSQGTLRDATSNDVTFMFVVLLVCICVVLLVSRRIPLLSFDPDTAVSLGVSLVSTQRILLFLGVALVAFATAITGPILFVSLAAPQLVRILTRSPQINIFLSGLFGSLLLLSGDLAAKNIFSGSVSVGVVTVIFGGAYLLLLLLVQSRRAS